MDWINLAQITEKTAGSCEHEKALSGCIICGALLCLVEELSASQQAPTPWGRFTPH